LVYINLVINKYKHKRFYIYFANKNICIYGNIILLKNKIFYFLFLLIINKKVYFLSFLFNFFISIIILSFVNSIWNLESHCLHFMGSISFEKKEYSLHFSFFIIWFRLFVSITSSFSFFGYIFFICIQYLFFIYKSFVCSIAIWIRCIILYKNKWIIFFVYFTTKRNITCTAIIIIIGWIDVVNFMVFFWIGFISLFCCMSIIVIV